MPETPKRAKMVSILGALLPLFGLTTFQGCQPTTSCVGKGTKIAVPGGNKLVENVRAGDTVLSYDTKRKKVVESIVKNVVHNSSDKFFLLNGVLKITSDHIIFSAQKNKWLKVEGLNTSHILLVYQGNLAEQQIISLSPIQGQKESFDLILEGPYNNYFAEGLLVHNKSPPIYLCHNFPKEGICLQKQDRGCMDEDLPGYCGENFRELCYISIDSSYMYDQVLGAPSYEDSLQFCQQNLEPFTLP